MGVILYEEIYGPFEQTLKAVQFAINSITSIELFGSKSSYASRTAIPDAFKKLEEISEESRTKLQDMFDKIAVKSLTSTNQQEIITDFNELLKSAEFEEYKKILAKIPKNQQSLFLHALFTKVEGKFLDARNNISNSISYIKNSEQLNKISSLDQGLYQLQIIVGALKKEIKNKKPHRLNQLTADFIILTIKIRGFIVGKVSQDELYNTIARIDQDLAFEDKKQLNGYLLALTN